MFTSYRDQLIARHLGGQKPAQQPPQQPVQAPQRGTARRIAGYLADALAGWNGQQGPYAASLFAERQAQDEEAAYQRRRADDYADWQKRQEWERANPAPRNNDTVADYNFIRETLGDDQAAEFLRNKANPPTYRVGPDGQFYRVDVAAPPTQPVGRLTPIEEGGAGNSAGGFPDPMKAPGRMTSGRRTVEGNRLVGGVANSRHLTGDAADYVGTTAEALRAYFGPDVRIIPESDHLHVQGIGEGRVPYYGRRGTTGLRTR